MGASWPGDDLPPEAYADDDMDFDDLYGVPKVNGTSPASNTSPATNAPKASVDSTAYERDEREAIQGTAAAVAQARPNDAPKAEKPLMVEVKPPSNTAKTSAPKAKPREEITDTAEDEFDYDPSLRPNPRIVVRPGAEHELAERGMGVLNREKTWYARGAEIVTPIHSGENSAFVGIATVPFARFYTRFCSLARWGKEKYNSETKEYEFIDTSAPRAVAESVFRAMQWPVLSYLRLVVDTPIIRPDGTIWQTPGYDEETGFYYAPTIEFPHIPDDSILEDAQAAMKRLLDIFRDFNYTKAGMVAVVISAIMSLVGRSAIEGPVPGHLFNAPQRGTGKTLQIRVASQIAFGHELESFHLPMPRENDIHESDRDEEQEKRLIAAARAGVRALMIDNVRNGGSFGGPVIDRYILAPGFVKGRLLGKNELISFPWFAPMLLTGNNVKIIGDTQRRFLESMLSPPCANPELRDLSEFKYDLAGGWALKNRAEIVAAILTILVAHARAGRPRGKRADISNLESWQRVIADAMVWAGGPDPSQFFVSRSDERDPEQVAIMQAMRYLYHKGAHPGGNVATGLTCKEMADELFCKEWVNRDREKCPPDAILDPCRDVLVEVVKPSKGRLYPEGKTLGYSFRTWKGRLIEGADIWGQEDGRARYAWRIVSQDGHGGTQRWSVEAKG